MGLTMRHDLKTEYPYFAAIKADEKFFEIRHNDRGFQKGDEVLLQEYYPAPLGGTYGNDAIKVEITYVTAFMQKDNWVVFGFKKVDKFKDEQ